MIEIPKRLRKQITRMRGLLGIDHWTITLSTTDKPGGKQSERVGHTQLTPEYYIAAIEIHNAIDDDLTREILVHEYLHVALAQVDQAMEQIKYLLPRKHRKLAERLYTDAQEQTIVRMSAGLVDVLLPAKEAKE